MLNPSLPIGRTGLVAWPKPVRNGSPIAPIGPYIEPFRAHVHFMLTDARAEEYFLIEAEVNPRWGRRRDEPHAHSFLVHWATNTVRDLSYGLDRSCALVDYYWRGRIVPVEPKHFAYTLHEMCDAIRKYQRFGPWQIQTR